MSEELIEVVIAETGEKMDNAVKAARREFSMVRTGRANSALVERISVEAYGTTMPMQQLASFSIPEARLLVIAPHDKANIPSVVRALQKSELGLSPSDDGTVVRLAFPPLNEQRRRELARLVNSMAEDSRNQIRGLRRAARKELDAVEKDGGVSSDAIARAADQVDTITRDHEHELEEARVRKEEELLEV